VARSLAKACVLPSGLGQARLVKNRPPDGEPDPPSVRVGVESLCADEAAKADVRILVRLAALILF